MERAARVMPIVNVLEDLHWADESTLLLLRHLAQRVGTVPYLLVGTYRDVELDVSKPFAKILETLVRERQATRIPLPRLPENEVSTLLEALADQPPPTVLARAIYRETDFVAQATHSERLDAQESTRISTPSAPTRYSRSKGLFAGVALDGSVITIDDSANEKAFGGKNRW